MDGHISHTDLRAFLDWELPHAEQARTERHLADCPDCRVRLQAVADRAAQVGARLSVLGPQLAEGPRPAAMVLSEIRQKKRKEQHTMLKTIFSRRPVWAGLGAVLVLAVAFSFAPVRAWAGEFLGLFRVQQIQVLPIDTTQLSSLSNDSSLVKQISQLFSESVTITRQPGEPTVAASAGEASELAGFGVRLLGAGQGAPRITVQDGTAFEVVIDRQRAQALLDEGGRSDLKLPASIDGAKISVDVPRGATVAYGNCPTASDTSQPDAGPMALNQYKTCAMLAQVPSPTVNTPPDLDIGQLAEIGLQFTGMSPQQAHEFSQSVDWTSTLVIPFPRNAMDYQQVSVDGVTGTLFYRGYDDGTAQHYTVVWIKNGIIYGLTGLGSGQQGLALAQSIR